MARDPLDAYDVFQEEDGTPENVTLQMLYRQNAEIIRILNEDFADDDDNDVEVRTYYPVHWTAQVARYVFSYWGFMVMIGIAIIVLAFTAPTGK